MNDVHHRCAVLGKPIAHSLSPVLHMAGYREFGLDDWSYTREAVGKEDLQSFLAGLDSTWSGLSLTMPLKYTILPYGTCCDVWSVKLSVANTAIFDWNDNNDGGRGTATSIRLYNTDVNGIVKAFEHVWGCEAAVRSQSGWPTGATAVILGNGNTALSALAACTQLQVPGVGAVTNVIVCARNPAHSGRLHELAQGSRPAIALRDGSLDEAAEAMLGADLVVSTLPAHAADGVAEDLMRRADRSAGNPLRAAARPYLLDVAYDPRPSALQKAWLACGGGTIGGEEMLLYQAIDQFVLMTGRGQGDAGLESAMRDALRKAL